MVEQKGWVDQQLPETGLNDLRFEAGAKEREKELQEILKSLEEVGAELKEKFNIGTDPELKGILVVSKREMVKIKIKALKNGESSILLDLVNRLTRLATEYEIAKNPLDVRREPLMNPRTRGEATEPLKKPL